MHRSSNILLNAVIAFTAACSSLSAIEVRFVPLNGEIASRMIGIRDDKELLPLKGLDAMKRSDPLSCVIGEQALQLVAIDREGDNGKPASVAIGISPAMKSPLVVILPDSDHPTGLRTIAIEDSDDAFQWGCLLFINTSGGPLTLQIDKEKKSLPEDKSPVVIQPGGAMRNMGVQIYKEEQPDEVLYSAVWEHDPDFRKMIVIVPPKNEKASAFDLVIIPQDKRVKP
jgi:hypothetical protein